jgi:2-polyprenyl-3-methyl-5-hydroxy-6-metoxy-1,4-benzoquinol methylase
MRILSFWRHAWHHGMKALRRDAKKEYDARFYDQVYRRGGDRQEYFKPPEESVYYPAWRELIARLDRNEARILELGCGPGQLASLLLRSGFRYLRGIDFSGEAIALARKAAGEGHWDKFVFGDLYDETLYRDVEYNTVICCEVLEHLERDLAVLDLLRPAAKVLYTVPNYASRSHVRHFDDEGQIRSRYGSSLEIRSIQKVAINPYGNALFLIDSHKKF